LEGFERRMVSSVAAGRVAQKGDARKMLVMADLADLVELAGLNRRQETNQRFPEAGLRRSEHRGNRGTLRSVVSEQDSDVLTGGDEVVLDLLPPKPAPTRPLKAVSVGRISKTPFAQMLSAAAILPGRRFVGLRPQPIQFGLPLKPLNAPARLAGGTVCAQYTLGACDVAKASPAWCSFSRRRKSVENPIYNPPAASEWRT